MAEIFCTSVEAAIHRTVYKLKRRERKCSDISTLEDMMDQETFVLTRCLAMKAVVEGATKDKMNQRPSSCGINTKDWGTWSRYD